MRPENMKSLFKGFVVTKNKKCIEKLKGRAKYKTYDEVKDFPEFAGVLKDDVILVDIDNMEQAEIGMNIVEDKQLNCAITQTLRGKHNFFKNTKITNNRTNVQLACGLTADIKVGSKTSYAVLKYDGEERFCEWDIEEGEQYQEIPKWLFPVKASADFVDMDAGDGRNQALFNYILTLTANDFSVEETRECIRILNKYVLKEPLSDEELEVILRDEAFQKPVFFIGTTFLFDRFATYLKNNNHIVKINGQLHIYKDGIYIHDMGIISEVMRSYVPNIKRNQKAEVVDYLNDTTEGKQPSDARYIAFNNGIYDMVEEQLKPFSHEIIITNKIPWDYVPDAYNKLADTTLNKLSCGDAPIRALLEECIGYCFYRLNVYKKSFMMTGGGDNGKSTFLDCVKEILGDFNISALDLKELGDRFSTSMMFGKLANIGDDIGDDFLQGSQVSTFKKIVAGNRIKAERKGQDPFEFNPFVKLLFSTNVMPLIKDKTGAVLRRLVIIPFNAIITEETDPDYDPQIKQKLLQKDSIEYLVRIGVKGLKRVIQNKGFTKSTTVDKAAREYDLMNNPIKGFFAEQEEDYIFRESVKSIYANYQIYCDDYDFKPESKIAFGKSVVEMFGVESYPTTIAGKGERMYRKI